MSHYKFRAGPDFTGPHAGASSRVLAKVIEDIVPGLSYGRELQYRVERYIGIHSEPGHVPDISCRAFQKEIKSAIHINSRDRAGMLLTAIDGVKAIVERHELRSGAALDCFFLDHQIKLEKRFQNMISSSKSG